MQFTIHFLYFPNLELITYSSCEFLMLKMKKMEKLQQSPNPNLIKEKYYVYVLIVLCVAMSRPIKFPYF